MNRTVKFRAWDGEKMRTAFDLSQNPKYWWDENKDFPLMQFTGLLDKNGVTEVYEGDMIDVEGKVIGNIYESPQVYKEGTYLVIEGLGTSAWRNTESAAMGFGFKYAK